MDYVVVGKRYKDRKGRIWTVDHITGPRLYPVSAHCWEGKYFRSRCFQRDGRFDVDVDGSLDLIEEVPCPTSN